MTSGKQTRRIGLIGECMIELQEDDQGVIHQSFAGDTLNTALYLARLRDTHQHQVHYITALGTDRFSNAMLKQWQEEGILCDKVRHFPDKLPGLYYVDIDAYGERSFQYWRGQSAARYLLDGSDFNAQLESLTAFDYLYLSGISLAILPPGDRQKLIALLHSARTRGAKICFDNNYRPRLWQSTTEAQHWYRELLQITDIAFLTFEDECLLWNENTPSQVFARCHQLGIGEIVLKRGTLPCLIDTKTGQESVAAITVSTEDLVDTNAAGDSFSAGYLARRLSDQYSPAECAVLGHKIASTVIQHRGAIIPRNAMPNISSCALT